MVGMAGACQLVLYICIALKPKGIYAPLVMVRLAAVARVPVDPLDWVARMRSLYWFDCASHQRESMRNPAIPDFKLRTNR